MFPADSAMLESLPFSMIGSRDMMGHRGTKKTSKELHLSSKLVPDILVPFMEYAAVRTSPIE